jgi:hypothetical protein
VVLLILVLLLNLNNRPYFKKFSSVTSLHIMCIGYQFTSHKLADNIEWDAIAKQRLGPLLAPDEDRSSSHIVHNVGPIHAISLIKTADILRNTACHPSRAGASFRCKK